MWHPDIAPPGKQLEHERHLKAINEAADQLEQLAEDSRGGRVTKNAVKVNAAAARRARAEEGRRAYEEEQRRAAAEAEAAALAQLKEEHPEAYETPKADTEEPEDPDRGPGEQTEEAP